MRWTRENHDEEEDLNEGTLKSIVRSIFLRHHMRGAEPEPEVAEEHVKEDEGPE